MKVADFDFTLPDELIASHPLSSRDASRLLVVDGEQISDRHVPDFVSYIRPGDVVVFNNSRVIPARFFATASDGRVYEMTLHTMVGDASGTHQVDGRNILPREWWALAKKFGRLKIGEKLTLADETIITVLDTSDDGIKIRFETDNVFGCLDAVGKMPLPPYMKRGEESDDRDRYQTVYSEPIGSMAAPTAGLHFTDKILEQIRTIGATIVNITLHVGAGTWMPVKSDDTDGHTMHSEWGVITPEQANIINTAKARGGRVFAIGTTSTRLLESAATGSGIEPFCGTTNIFIIPGYKFKIVDVMFTNFHLPKSTLFMLVSAFAGVNEMRAAYQHAIDERYRFFSYGDACLLFKKDGE